jgi:hypothetical protein
MGTGLNIAVNAVTSVANATAASISTSIGFANCRRQRRMYRLTRKQSAHWDLHR